MESVDRAAEQNPARLLIPLLPARRSRFYALLDGFQIVKASTSPISDAARVLHRRGYSNDLPATARPDRASYDAMYGLLGVWRKIRVREDRGPPRLVTWEPLPHRARTKIGNAEAEAAAYRGDGKDVSARTPGAGKTLSAASRTSGPL